MIDMIKRKKRELYCVEEEEIHLHTLNDFFEKSFVGEILYVKKNGKVNGIITRGDYLNHIYNDKPLVNRNFKFLTEDNLSEITERVKNPDIHRVPVVKDGDVIYDFVLTTDFYEQIYWDGQMALTTFLSYLKEAGVKTLAYINNIESADRMRENLKRYRFTQIEVTCVCDYHSANADDTLYIDNNFFRQCRMKRENHCYQVITEAQLMHAISRPGRYVPDLKNVCELIKHTYRSIAIYDRNQLSRKMMQALDSCGACYDVVTEDDITFCADTNGYYLDDGCKKYDVLITTGYDTICWPVSYKGDIVYCLNVLNRGVTSWVGTIAGGFSPQNQDIINNVLPSLINIGVKIVIVESMSKWNGLERISYNALCKYGINTPLEKIYGMSCPWLKVRYNFEKGYASSPEHHQSYFNIEAGIRKTLGNTGADKKIYFVGGCQYYGAFLKDEDTVASYFQELVGEPYDVRNYSLLRYAQTWRLREPIYKKDDIVIIEVDNKEIYERHGYQVHELTEIFHEFAERAEELTWDIWAHGNAVISKRVAELIYDICKDENVL